MHRHAPALPAALHTRIPEDQPLIVIARDDFFLIKTDEIFLITATKKRSPPHMEQPYGVESEQKMIRSVEMQEETGFTGCCQHRYDTMCPQLVIGMLQMRPDRRQAD
jgi:hypothetical protein